VWDWLALGLSALAAGAAISARRARRGRADDRPGWTECFDDAGLGEPTRGRGLELRARGEFSRWTISVPVLSGVGTDLVLESERIDFEGRLYVDWDRTETPSSVAHWPAVEARPRRAVGRFEVRGDTDPDREIWLEAAYVDLLDLRTQSAAAGLELLVRGGYVRITLFGARPAPGLVRRVFQAADRVAQRLPAG